MSLQDSLMIIGAIVSASGLTAIATYVTVHDNEKRAAFREVYERVYESLTKAREITGLEPAKNPEEIVGDMGISYVQDILEETINLTVDRYKSQVTLSLLGISAKTLKDVNDD